VSIFMLIISVTSHRRIEKTGVSAPCMGGGGNIILKAAGGCKGSLRSLMADSMTLGYSKQTVLCATIASHRVIEKLSITGFIKYGLRRDNIVCLSRKENTDR